ncbi:MAG: hypothetical protein ACRC1H_13005, partial [Caldilineaceae bacterium]
MATGQSMQPIQLKSDLHSRPAVLVSMAAPLAAPMFASHPHPFGRGFTFAGSWYRYFTTLSPS